MLVPTHRRNLGVVDIYPHAPSDIYPKDLLPCRFQESSYFLAWDKDFSLTAYHFLNVLFGTIEDLSLHLCAISLISLASLLSLYVVFTPSESPLFSCLSRDLVIQQVPVKRYQSLMLSWFLNTFTVSNIYYRAHYNLNFLFICLLYHEDTNQCSPEKHCYPLPHRPNLICLNIIEPK